MIFCHTTRKVVFLLAISLSQIDAALIHIVPAGGKMIRPVGDKIILFCNVVLTQEEVFSVSKIEWFFDNVQGQRQRHNGTETIIGTPPRNSQFLIERSTVDDTGNYTCKATAEEENAAPKEQTIQVLIFSDIQFQDFPRQVRTLQGEEARIQCLVKASPPPQINWRRMQGHMPEAHRFEDSNQTLIIPNFDVASHGGLYICQVQQLEIGHMQSAAIQVMGGS